MQCGGQHMAANRGKPAILLDAAVPTKVSSPWTILEHEESHQGHTELGPRPGWEHQPQPQWEIPWWEFIWGLTSKQEPSVCKLKASLLILPWCTWHCDFTTQTPACCFLSSSRSPSASCDDPPTCRNAERLGLTLWSRARVPISRGKHCTEFSFPPTVRPEKSNGTLFCPLHCLPLKFLPSGALTFARNPFSPFQETWTFREMSTLCGVTESKSLTLCTLRHQARFPQSHSLEKKKRIILYSPSPAIEPSHHYFISNNTVLFTEDTLSWNTSNPCRFWWLGVEPAHCNTYWSILSPGWVASQLPEWVLKTSL